MRQHAKDMNAVSGSVIQQATVIGYVDHLSCLQCTCLQLLQARVHLRMMLQDLQPFKMCLPGKGTAAFCHNRCRTSSAAPLY